MVITVDKKQLCIAESLLPHVKENNQIGFVTLSKGMDPDDYIREKGKKAFKIFYLANCPYRNLFGKFI